MWEKVVRGVAVGASNPTDDFVALIDMLELQLDINTGRRSLPDRLTELAAEVKRSNNVVGSEQLNLLVETAERLTKIQQLLSEFWTQSRTPAG